uniref:ENTH domain-containing protein n=1 Tax=Sus scrofa TaxID=9823 RepID=A0A8D0N9C8_PIG
IRQMKNIMNIYSKAERKARETTSNDPWGPSSSLMTEITDLTCNVVAFSASMGMARKGCQTAIRQTRQTSK